MRVLVACEFSGVVRDAFRAQGHEAVSCDLLPSEASGPHHQGDVREILGDGWDLMVAHPPCTHLAVSGARWFKEKQAEQAEALAFVATLLEAPIPRIALENPVSIILLAHPETRPDHPAMDVRARRDQGHLLVAQGPADTPADGGCVGT